MIYGVLILIVLAIVFGYRFLNRGPGQTRASHEDFDVAKMRATELRLKYKFNFAQAVNFERNGQGSGVSTRDAKDAVDKCILIRHRLDVIEGKLPIGGGDKSPEDYRQEIMVDVRDAARGGQA